MVPADYQEFANLNLTQQRDPNVICCDFATVSGRFQCSVARM